ncbi:MAG TPA: L,D-transpeptidase [Pyrinomonadaceae bacterium]|jgi:murein L,D-transpeptidase YafK
MPKRGLTLLLLACAASAACGVLYAGARVPSSDAEDEAINRRPLKLPLTSPKIVVEKGARRLTLYSGGERVRVFRVVLGFEPAGDKVREGDGRTPVGDFYVCMKNERSKFYLSLGLSYPNAEDAERGLRDGLITRAQARQITSAVARGAKPPWNTALGGEIFIHGGGTSDDWTWGCVALENEHIKELFDAVPLGTHVRIEP